MHLSAHVKAIYSDVFNNQYNIRIDFRGKVGIYVIINKLNGKCMLVVGIYIYDLDHILFVSKVIN